MELDADATSAEDAVERRDDVVAAVRDHAGGIARSLSRLDGSEYGRRSFPVEGGEWTLKYEDGGLAFLRFQGRAGLDVYVVSTKRAPEPEPLARAMEHYDAFVAAYDEYVASMRGVLDDVATAFPAPASAGDVVAERDCIVARIREVADEMAGELHRYEGAEYGTFARTVDGTRWELKWADGRTAYLRVGGEGGVYLLSQYGRPAAPDVREYAPDFAGFVETYNDHVREVSDALATVSL